jgi:hypothetical protein
VLKDSLTTGSNFQLVHRKTRYRMVGRRSVLKKFKKLEILIVQKNMSGKRVRGLFNPNKSNFVRPTSYNKCLAYTSRPEAMLTHLKPNEGSFPAHGATSTENRALNSACKIDCISLLRSTICLLLRACLGILHCPG